MEHKITIAGENVGERIDKFISENFADITRSYAQKLIDGGNITVGGVSALKTNYKLRFGDTVSVEMPELQELEVRGEDIPLSIIYEDDHLLVVNKPQGIVVHPAAGNFSGTLVNALIHHCGESLSGINGVIRPGIVHRIDKDTSGLLLVAKNDAAHQSLAAQIKDRSVVREYNALLHGNLKEDKGTVDAPIGRSEKDRKKMAVTNRNSRDAVTHYEVLARYPGYTFAKCRLETGRTHQIRVHMASLGHSVVGDKVYGRPREKFKLDGQLLHASRLGFTHPLSGEYMEFESDLPECFGKVIEKLERM
ncbi:MAG: RluA family pseudouridine synthase [Oscillospiraceae bacterium]|nr:RluA family pseudouridine synthase [Oscillospiraceae bacterium]